MFKFEIDFQNLCDQISIKISEEKTIEKILTEVIEIFIQNVENHIKENFEFKDEFKAKITNLLQQNPFLAILGQTVVDSGIQAGHVFEFKWTIDEFGENLIEIMKLKK